MESKTRGNEPLYKTGKGSHTQKTNLWSPKGKGVNPEFGVTVYTALYVKWVGNRSCSATQGSAFNIW